MRRGYEYKWFRTHEYRYNLGEILGKSDSNAVAVSRPTEVFAAKTCCLGEEQVLSLNFSLKTDYSEEHKGELVKGPGWDKSISHYR